MCVLDDSDRRWARKDVWNLVPEEVLDIRSPKIHCKSITKFTVQNVDRLHEERYLIEIRSQRRSEYHIDRIDQNSIKSARLAVDALAKYFRREFNYDFVQYEANEITDDRDRVYLLTVNRYSHWLGVGSICFRWREWTDAPHRLALSWLWINPFLRRKGIVSLYWDGFRNLYGDFLVEPPLSPAMKAFLAKRKECWWCGRACMCDKRSE